MHFITLFQENLTVILKSALSLELHMNIRTVKQRLAHRWGVRGTRFNLVTNVKQHCLELEWGVVLI